MRIIITKPKGWRNGQTIFNFLQWLKDNKKAPGINMERCGDPFHISDDILDGYYEQFMVEIIDQIKTLE